MKSYPYVVLYPLGGPKPVVPPHIRPIMNPTNLTNYSLHLQASFIRNSRELGSRREKLEAARNTQEYRNLFASDKVDNSQKSLFREMKYYSYVSAKCHRTFDEYTRQNIVPPSDAQKADVTMIAAAFLNAEQVEAQKIAKYTEKDLWFYHKKEIDAEFCMFFNEYPEIRFHEKTLCGNLMNILNRDDFQRQLGNTLTAEDLEAYDKNVETKRMEKEARDEWRASKKRAAAAVASSSTSIVTSTPTPTVTSTPTVSSAPAPTPTPTQTPTVTSTATSTVAGLTTALSSLSITVNSDNVQTITTTTNNVQVTSVLSNDNNYLTKLIEDGFEDLEFIEGFKVPCKKFKRVPYTVEDLKARAEALDKLHNESPSPFPEEFRIKNNIPLFSPLFTWTEASMRSALESKNSNTKRINFHAELNALENDKSIDTNTYDCLSTHKNKSFYDWETPMTVEEAFKGYLPSGEIYDAKAGCFKKRYVEAAYPDEPAEPFDLGLEAEM